LFSSALTGLLPAVGSVGGDAPEFRRALKKKEIAKYIAIRV
jgi:hypothetical protein